MKKSRMKRLSNFPTALYPVILLAALAKPSALGADRTWVGGYGTSGTWNQASQWSEGAYANASDVIFNNVAGTSTTSTFLSLSRTVNSITFNGGTPSPAFTIRLATTGSGGTAANLTFIPNNTGITIAAANTAAHNIGLSDGNIVLQDDLLVTHNGTGTLTLSRPVTGAGFNLTKAGTGLLVLSAANTINGDTIVNAGKLRATVGGSSVNSELVLNSSAATFSTNVTNNTLSWTCSALTAAAAGTLEFNFGAVTPSTSQAPLVVTSAANFTAATPLVSVLVNAGLVPGTYPLMTWGTTSGTAPTTANLTVSQIAPGTAAALAVSGNTLNLVITSTAVSIVKADNTNNLSLGTSWVGGVAPTSAQIALWNNTVTSANTTVLGANVAWAGIAIENPAGPVTVGAGNTLTLGGAALEIDMTAATSNLTLDCPVALAEANIWNIASTRTLAIGGQISGAFGITKLGTGTAVLSSTANNYTGTTTVTAGTLKLGTSNVIPNGAGVGSVVLNGTLDVNGALDRINGLTGSGFVDNTAVGTSGTLEIGNNNVSSTFNGILRNTGSGATLNLAKVGTGTSILTGANTLSGTVSVSSGTLAFTNIAPFANASALSLSGGATLRPDVDDGEVDAPISLGTVGTTSVITAPSVEGAGGTNPVNFFVDGAITGAGNLNLTGIQATNAYGNIILRAASTYTGSTRLTTISAFGGGSPDNANIFVVLGVTNALPTTTVVTLDGGDGTGTGRFCYLDLNGRNQTLAGLTNVTGLTDRTQRVYNTSANPATLTINNTADFTYTGQIGNAGANMGLTKTGAGVFTLSGAKSYTGATIINGGTLRLGSSNVLANATAVSIGAGTLAISGGFTDTAGTLNATAAATINLGNATSALVFADSSALPAWAGTLNITGAFVPGFSLRFGTTASGLTSAQLSKISATGYTNFQLNASGFLTATASSGFTSWITGTFANGTIPGAQQGPNDDFDNDGVSNLMEYAIDGQDPTVPNAAVGTFAANTLSFTKRAGTSGLTYAIQESTDLGVSDPWSEVSGGSYINNATTISYTLTPGSPARDFVRLQVVTN
jgi:fibronectin-binding autotransporter adhesin